jgi:hypothetical protein
MAPENKPRNRLRIRITHEPFCGFCPANEHGSNYVEPAAQFNSRQLTRRNETADLPHGETDERCSLEHCEENRVGLHWIGTGLCLISVSYNSDRASKRKPHFS